MGKLPDIAEAANRTGLAFELAAAPRSIITPDKSATGQGESLGFESLVVRYLGNPARATPRLQLQVALVPES